MYVREITKDTVFIKKVGNAYLVDEKEVDGIRTIRTTKNPIKAAQFTAENVYPLVYNNLSESEVKRVTRGHEEDDSYSLLSRFVTDQYLVISAVDINYGYKGDRAGEQALLSSIGMDYVFNPIKINVESIDPIIVEEEE